MVRIADPDAELAKLRGICERIRQHRKEVAADERKRDALMRRLVASGELRVGAIARAAGVTSQRVSQLTAPAVEEPVAVKGQEPMLTLADLSPEVPEPTYLLAGITSRREYRHYRRRRTVFRKTGSVRLWGLLEAARGDHVERVYLVGERGTAEEVRGYFLADPGRGWSTASVYLADADHPVGRYVHQDGRAVEVHRAATWFGEGAYGLEEAASAYEALDMAIAESFPAAGMLATPLATGRDLWLRSIPHNAQYPVLSEELRQLVQSTAGQGRIELRPEPEGAPRGFGYVDARLAYAAHVWGLPVGAPTWHTRENVRIPEAEQDELLELRGRFRARVRVPDSWGHVGLLMAPDGSEGWRFPDRPGESFVTWADASELRFARRHGWRVELLEGFTQAEGRPLTTWRDKLLPLAVEHPNATARHGARAMLLHTIGGFSQRPRLVTRVASAAEAKPTGPVVDLVNLGAGRVMWQEQEVENGSAASTFAHPEWSATIWARARRALLAGVRGGFGALALPVEQIIGFRTDAIYLAGAPEVVEVWPDDGQVGTFRVKGWVSGAPWPASWSALQELRRRAEQDERP